MYSQEESLAFCAGQCQASRFPPSSCRCICQGRNHGVLARNRVFEVHGPYRQGIYSMESVPNERVSPYFLPNNQYFLPAIEQTKTVWKDEPRKGDTVEIRKGKARLKTVKSVLKTVTGYRSADDLNSRILSGLHNQFNQDRIDAIVDQAFSVFYQRMGPESNRPELYELYENGDIDRALSLFNVRWVIGRPKKN